MDALLRRCLTDSLHGSLSSRHYAGLADGPCQPFGVEPGAFQEASETLLLVAPEYQALRTLVLDYFDSISRCVTNDHMIFSFDKGMMCGEGDCELVEQIGLCLGLDAARREAPQLLTGERPELLELFPELAWFRDTVFLWKMLLLPACQCPAVQKWRASDSSLKWQYKKGRFEVIGFQTTLTPEAKASKPGFLQGVLRWFGQYESDKKSLSRASPSVLTGSSQELVNNEDDVLFLKELPSFNGALGAADVELLLSYLTAPYLRIPLVLGFFADRHRASALREPQLQVILDAVLFEPGPWQSPSDLLSVPPETVPAPDRRHLATGAGLLFNELMRSPQSVVHAVLSLLQVAVEKDVGRPNSANDGLILYIIRLASRIESYLAFLVSHGRRGAYLERAGASYQAFVRSLARPEDDSLLNELEAAHREIRRQLQGDVLRMLNDWLRYASKRPEKLLPAACRVHAHIALIFKNVPSLEVDSVVVAGFLSAQAFLNINHRWLEDTLTSGDTGRLGVGEVELFDAFEARRSSMATWLSDSPSRASLVLRMVEKAVTQNSDQEEMEWAELRPGEWVPRKHMPPESWFRSQPGEAFPEWIFRTVQGGAGGRQVSVNLGQYGTKRDALELLPSWAVCSPDFQEAFGRLDAHCVEREAAAKRVWKDLVGHGGFSIQRWLPDESQSDPHTEAWRGTPPSWALSVLQPVISALPQLKDFELRLQQPVREDANEIWLGAVPTDLSRPKELRVQRSPPLVEVYNILEHGRHFYRTMVFSSDTAWSFHVHEGLSCKI
ncbi:unnamed protein product [Durusdinium trenchii]|uniref:ubiquitinyl hydrolase 1 n=1 Tax=Durusdinium trenchii TaxID=1381693 RepID=A0ABP0H8W0_9DINO